MNPILPTLIVSFLLTSLLQAASPIDNAQEQWPMASGPDGTWTTTSDQAVPTEWSVSTDQNILWKTELPEGGQSGTAVWKDRLFLTINRPLPEVTPLENAEGSDIIGYCLDSNTGEVLWTREIPSPKTMPYSGLFSDNTSCTPITDGKHVWFINHGGLMVCYDMKGNEIWNRSFESRSRHNAKQAEPILVDDQLLFVMMREPNDPLRRPMLAKPRQRNTPPEHWPKMHIRSFDALTGEPLWTEPSGTSVHNTPRFGYIDGEAHIFHARGGGHEPPEMPYGYSMSLVGGEALWNYEANDAAAYTVSHFNEKHAYGWDAGNLLQFDSKTGDITNSFPSFEKADIRLWDTDRNRYNLHRDSPFTIVAENFRTYPTNQTPILVGKYYLFLSHSGHCIGRIDTETGKTEFLQVPIQVVRKPGSAEQSLWDSHIPSQGRNSRGMRTANDKRSERDGWGHVTAGSPIAVNEYVFFSTMIGMTYVVDSQAPVFDKNALVSINDLGPASDTWSLSTVSYANGRIFHRGLKHVVCVDSSK
ncbi:MAG: PQQ-binding-like beta-propeller repeat protein [Opitutales bacterium]|nr:PQQ-binding-like beta-propeller repeat protein [Opitutales bacterium]